MHDMYIWRRSCHTLYNAKSQISHIVHHAHLISRFQSYFKFGVAKLFLGINYAVSLTSLSIPKSYD